MCGTVGTHFRNGGTSIRNREASVQNSAGGCAEPRCSVAARRGSHDVLPRLGIGVSPPSVAGILLEVRRGAARSPLTRPGYHGVEAK